MPKSPAGGLPGRRAGVSSAIALDRFGSDPAALSDVAATKGEGALSNPSLEGKVAIVTGASKGIGAFIARELRAHGASVGLLAVRGRNRLPVRGTGRRSDRPVSL